MNFIHIILSEIAQIQQKKKDLRNFAYIFFAAGIIFSGLAFYKKGIHSQPGIVLAGAAVIFLLLGIIKPELLKRPHKIWMTFAVILGYFMTKIILLIIFFLVFTPVAMLLKILRKDILDLKIDEKEKSFWKNHTHVKEKERYRKMF